ncbi:MULTISPECIES: hypothetical protein [Micromonospora]|uniref:hypothetical protein n=2 Tax=Micromonospora TaxID=1873 RepID=UPI00081F7C4B|nr:MULTISPECIES: hypothetical protein [Micromonospora]MBQ0978918.1 hypothetical protein [Micromonospora sp. M61]MBQ1039737.1 hypothetical protein [Micromonospora sp. C81]WTI21233.1 hypothetical protein OG886_30785 [Micromonospora zamorensis]SCG63428.1 hypothetical protein GA0070619_4770 [Micromonospora zamorensis]
MKIFTYERLAVMPSVHAPLSAVRVALTAARPSVPQVHQVQTELSLTLAPVGVEGTSGFTGNGIQVAKKRMDVRGVPPRGKPV